MEKQAVASTPTQVKVTVSIIEIDGQYKARYAWDGKFDQKTCNVECYGPTNIVFSLDTTAISSGWNLAGFSHVYASADAPHKVLGFTKGIDSNDLIVYNPCTIKGTKHSFLIYGSLNGTPPTSFDPEAENKGGGATDE
jgi:hypothetical protein